MLAALERSRCPAGAQPRRATKGGRVHAFLVDDGHELTLDRHALRRRRPPRAGGATRARPSAATTLRHIVLTHAHRSHLGGLAALKRLSGATVYAHEWEADIIAGERQRAARDAEADAVAQDPAASSSGSRSTYRSTRPATSTRRVERRRPGRAARGAPRARPLAGAPRLLRGPSGDFLIAGDAIATWPQFSAGWRAFNLNKEQHAASVRRMAELDAEGGRRRPRRPDRRGRGRPRAQPRRLTRQR